MASLTDKMKLRAIRDFNSKQIKDVDRNILKSILSRRKRVYYSELLPFKKGYIMKVIPPSTIDFRVGWWMARHLKSGETGFIPRNRIRTIFYEKGIVRATHDFYPAEISLSEFIEVENILKIRKHQEFIGADKKLEVCEEGFKPGQNRGHQNEFQKSVDGDSEDIQHDGKISDRDQDNDRQLAKSGCKDDSRCEERSVCRDTNESGEEVTMNLAGQNHQLSEKMAGEMKVIEREDPDVVYEKPEDIHLMKFGKEQKNERPTKIDPDEFNSDDEADQYAKSIPFKKGDIMETISPENIGDYVEWWMVRHLNSGKIGFIQRDSVVIKYDHQPSQTSETTLNEPPLDLLDIILEISLLFWILNSPQQQRDEDVIKALASVDYCWLQRITRQRFKKRIWHRLKVFYDKIKKTSAIIRNNRNYLLENIQPNDKLISTLVSFNVIKEQQGHFLQRRRSNRDRNAKLLDMLRDFDQTKYSHFILCLRRNKQMTVARIIETGGVVMKVEVQKRGAKSTTSKETEQFHQAIEDLRNSVKSRSHKTCRLITQLKEEGVEILNSQMNRHTVIIWIRCQSRAAVQYVQKLYESIQLRRVLCGLPNIRLSFSEIILSAGINIDSNQFKETVVVSPISFDFAERIDIPRISEEVLGVTKLRNEIYVLTEGINYGISHLTLHPPTVYVFGGRDSFHLQRTFEVREIISPVDIGSSEKENCLYVSDSTENVWKITGERNDQHKIIKWLTTDFQPRALSVFNNGHLLLIDALILRIYGSDGELLQSIPLPEDFKHIRCAVETSIGNFIILHDSSEIKSTEEEIEEVANMDFLSDSEEAMKEGSSSVTYWQRKPKPIWCISEVTRDGQMVHTLIASDEIKELIDPVYLSLDPDDRVFVADKVQERVILLDSELRLIRILCPPTKEENKEEINRSSWSWRLCYDEENNRLIVSRKDGVNIYSMSRT